MGGGVALLSLTTPFLKVSSIDFTHFSLFNNSAFGARKSFGIHCSSSTPDFPVITEHFEDVIPLTGGALDFRKATTSLSPHRLSSPKKITLVRHGLSSWNAESRVQGSSDLSVLTDAGVKQAERCRKALANMHFDICFSSPISRAKSTAEIMWQERDKPLVYLDSLKEAHLFYLEGMKNAFGGRGC